MTCCDFFQAKVYAKAAKVGLLLVDVIEKFDRMALAGADDLFVLPDLEPALRQQEEAAQKTAQAQLEKLAAECEAEGVCELIKLSFTC